MRDSYQRRISQNRSMGSPQRTAVGTQRGGADIQPAVPREAGAVPSHARRRHTVEEIHAAPCPLHEILRKAHPHQVARPVARERLGIEVTDDDATLHQCVRSGKARYLLHVECKRTYYRGASMSDGPRFEMLVSGDLLFGLVEVSLLVVATKDLKAYRHPGQHTDYRDTGCHLSASCLGCPLERCQYDEPLTPRQSMRAARDREIALLRKRHRAPIALLAGAYGLTPRAIFRILSAQRR